MIPCGWWERDCRGGGWERGFRCPEPLELREENPLTVNRRKSKSRHAHCVCKMHRKKFFFPIN